MVNRCLPHNYLTFPCKICNKTVNDHEYAIQCDICNFWIHIKCNNLNYINYKYLQGNNDPWYCITCSSSIFLFNCLNNKKIWLIRPTLKNCSFPIIYITKRKVTWAAGKTFFYLTLLFFNFFKTKLAFNILSSTKDGR